MKRFGWMWGLLLGLGLVGALVAPGSGESPTGDSLVQLREIAVEPRNDGLAVQIKTSGPTAYQTSLIDTPTRLIIDLESTGYGWRKTPLIVEMDPLRQIRGSQFRKGVSRVVLELTRKVGYRIEEGPEGLTVMLEPSATAAAPAKAEAKPVEVAKAEPADAKPSAEAASPADSEPPAAKAEAPKPVEPPAVPKAEAPVQETAKETEAPKAEPVKPPALSPKAKAPKQPVVAAAPPPPIRLAQAAQTPPVANGSRLISLDFKDADITNILRILAAESGKNIVAGDDVKGKLSISLHNVPWELALETVLEARGLQKLEKDNVMRIVSTEQLTREREAKAKAEEAKVKGEAEARTKLAEAQLKEAEAQQKKRAAEEAMAEAQARGPLREETVRVNYADPEDVAKTLQGILGIPEGGAPAAAGLTLQPGVTPSLGLGGAPPTGAPPFSSLYGPQAGDVPAGGAPISASAEVLAKGLTIRANKAT
ncbi:MAG: AMIN domain-containing protein, partial [Candidatus Rokubacteria bacterium]|nr:AMIN domain-containing protein [Candidatus Rokubacteria bacterium]